jgi:thioredoxin 1
MYDTPLITNDQSIDRVLAAGLPVLLVFISPPAPTALADAMKQIASEHAGKLLVAQVNIKDNPESARRFDIHSSPVVVGFLKEQVVTRQDLITGPELPGYALFLLGKGPNPTPGTGANPKPGGTPVTATDRTFDQLVLHSRLPVLVDFWAPWCGPCRMTEPAVARLAREYAGKLVVAKVNTDENPALSERYRIMSIPMMLIVKNGQVVDSWTGALPEPNLRGRVLAVLSQG